MEARHEQSVKDDIIETLKLLISTQMLKLTPVILWTSLGNAVIPSIFVPMMTDSMSQFESSDQKNKYCLLALVGLGVGEIIGA